MFRSRTISIPIYRSYEEVYEFLVEPRNFPSWASNLGPDFPRISDYEWSTSTRNGRVILRFRMIRKSVSEPVLLSSRRATCFASAG